MKAVQFIERPLRFQWLYKGKKIRKNKMIGQIERGFTHQSHKVCITVKKWREWRKYLKWRKQQKKLRRKQKSKLLGKKKKVREMSKVPPIIPRDSTTTPRIDSTSMSTRSSSPTTKIRSTKQWRFSRICYFFYTKWYLFQRVCWADVIWQLFRC